MATFLRVLAVVGMVIGAVVRLVVALGFAAAGFFNILLWVSMVRQDNLYDGGNLEKAIEVGLRLGSEFHGYLLYLMPLILGISLMGMGMYVLEISWRRYRPRR